MPGTQSQPLPPVSEEEGGRQAEQPAPAPPASTSGRPLRSTRNTNRSADPLNIGSG